MSLERWNINTDCDKICIYNIKTLTTKRLYLKYAESAIDKPKWNPKKNLKVQVTYRKSYERK